jgi:hypothetical protein
MRTEQWVKNLSGHAGELFVCAELSKRGILAVLLPRNFTGEDIMISSPQGGEPGFVQVKSCHPDRSHSFLLTESADKWCDDAAPDHYCVFVWLGRTKGKEPDDPPRYWIATKQEVGELCANHTARQTANWERRFRPPDAGGKHRNVLRSEWLNRWSLFHKYEPPVR